MKVVSATDTVRRNRDDLEIFNMRSAKELAEISQVAYNQYLCFVRSFVTVFTINDQEQADSIANDAYRNVLKNFDPNRLGPGDLAAFFKRVIRNCAISSERLRISHSTGTVPLDCDGPQNNGASFIHTLASPDIDPATAAQWREVGELVLSTVADLRDKTLKQIGLAMVTEGTGSKLEIARAAGISLSSVKDRISELTNLLKSRVSRAV